MERGIEEYVGFFDILVWNQELKLVLPRKSMANYYPSLAYISLYLLISNVEIGSDEMNQELDERGMNRGSMTIRQKHVQPI